MQTPEKDPKKPPTGDRSMAEPLFPQRKVSIYFESLLDPYPHCKSRHKAGNIPYGSPEVWPCHQ